MEQEKINKYLRWFEKGIRIFVGFAILFQIAVFIALGLYLWVNGKDILITLPAWVLGIGIASFIAKTFIGAYIVFGRWHIEYTKKVKTDSTLLGKDW